MRQLRRALAWPSRLRSPTPWVLLTAACSVLCGAQPALAHTSLVSSSPASNAVVAGPVDVVTLRFDEAVTPRRAEVVVTGPDGADVADGEAQVSGGTVSRSVPAWPMSGEYRMAYRVLAEDGHPITGEVPFEVTLSAASTTPTAPQATVAPRVSGTAEATGRAAPPAASGVAPALMAVLVGGGVLLLVGAVRAGRRAPARR